MTDQKPQPKARATEPTVWLFLALLVGAIATYAAMAWIGPYQGGAMLALVVLLVFLPVVVPILALASVAAWLLLAGPVVAIRCGERVWPLLIFGAYFGVMAVTGYGVLFLGWEDAMWVRQ